MSRAHIARGLPWAMALPALAALSWSQQGLAAGADLSSVPALLVAAVAAELLKVTIYEARQQTWSFSLTVLPVMAAVTTQPLFGPPAGLLVGLVHVLLVRQRSPAKIVFNTANPAVAATAASGAYILLAPHGLQHGFEIGHLIGALVAVGMYYLVNTGVVTAMISLHSGRPFRAVAQESIWFGPTSILLGLTGAFLGGVHELLGLMGAGMFLVPVLVMRFTLSFYARRSRQAIKTLEAQAEQLDHQARHDALTGLANRTELQRCLDDEMSGHPDECLALLLIDLDRFKEINDTFGHDYGDRLLQEVGPRIESVLSSGDLVARLGGDEFAVLLRSSGAIDAMDTAARLLRALDGTFDVEGHHLHVSGSIGVAAAPEHGTDAATLLRRADVAMYLAKTSHSGAALYSKERDEYSPAKLALVGDLRNALERDELVLHFQPKVNLRTGHADGVEALVRWQRSDGLVAPDVFIPLAEHTGLIKPLTRYVLNKALEHVKDWRARGWDLPVAVNASMQDLHDTTFPHLIGDLLATHGVPARYLRIEVTESAAMADLGRTIDVLSQIKSLGVGVSVDDFGTGYSSLAYLKRLPIDELKVDRSFVRYLATDAADSAIVRSTIALGHDLGMSVTAEGAEDSATVDALRRLGCDRVQGYVFSKPLPNAALHGWLERQTRNRAAAA